jgi:amidase
MIRSVAKGTRLKLQEHQTNLSKRSLLINNLEKRFTSWDAIICPVMSVPAFPHCEPSAPIRVDDQSVEYWTASISFTCPFNLTGHPVVAIPAAQSQSGLPIGTQLVGKRWHEMHLLSVAKRISEIVGPYQPPPGY